MVSQVLTIYAVAVHAAIVAGYDEVTNELLLADASPKVYRGEWHAALPTIFKACCEVAPAPVSRSRGAIRYSLLSRGDVQQRISQHGQDFVHRPGVV